MTRPSYFRIFAKLSSIVLATGTMLLACGAVKDEDHDSADATRHTARDRIVTPPKEYYDSLLARNMNLAASGTLAAKQDQVLWLNFNGATVKSGYNDGESFIPCKNSVTIPSSKISADNQSQIAAKVAAYFSKASVKLLITLERPAFGDYTTMHIGGSYSNLGCPGGNAVLGIAPFDVANANPNDIAFTFSANISDINRIAETVAHESGHSFGLDHTTNRLDIMYAVETGKNSSFTKGTIQGSNQEQDGPLLLQQNLSSGVATVNGSPIVVAQPAPIVSTTPSSNQPSTTNPTAPIFSNLPGNTAVLPGINNLANINSILNGTNSSVFNSLAPSLPSIISSLIPGGANLPNAQGALGVLSILLNSSVSQNNGAFDITKMIGLIAGGTVNLPFLSSSSGINLNSGLISSPITPLAINGITTTSATPSGINVAQLIGLASMSNPGVLIALMPVYAQLINANSTGANNQALTSLIMMGVTQQYNNIQVTVP